MRALAQIAAGFVAGALAATVVILGLRGHETQAQTLGAMSAPADRAAGPAARSQEPGAASRAATTPAAAGLESAGSDAGTDHETIEQLKTIQIAALQARVRELERKAAPDPNRESTPPARAKLHDFTDAELQERARNCVVSFDLPRLAPEPFHLPPDKGARLHLSDAEQERVAAAVDAASKDVVAHLRAFYLEATGDAAGADSLDPASLMSEVLQKSPRAAVDAARAEIARERAGLPPAPSNTIAERFLRYLASVGDSLQRALEPALGAQQASAVRDALAEHQSFMGGCPK